MKIKIIYDKKQIKKELPFIERNIQHFKKNKMFFYFPFEPVAMKDNLMINKQIKKDEERLKIEQTKNKIINEWEKKEEIVFKLLREYNNIEKCMEIRGKYVCFLIFYGCYGYYDYPDKIFININAKIEFILETIIHELIHLFVYQKSKNKEYHEIESLVDSIFINSGLNEIFSKYKKQDIN